jgi:transposase-like protein
LPRAGLTRLDGPARPPRLSPADAIRRESNQAVAYWFGVSDQTVSKWRKALGVDMTGTARGIADDTMAADANYAATIRFGSQ